MGEEKNTESNGYVRKSDVAIAEIKKDIGYLTEFTRKVEKTVDILIACKDENKNKITAIEGQTKIQWYFLAVIIVGLIVAGLKIFS